MSRDLEYGCHVRDVLRTSDVRLGLMIAEDGPHLTNWDQDATAVKDRHDLQEPAIVSAELLAAAHAFADHFDSVSDDQWGRRRFWSDDTESTVDSLAPYLMDDSVHHLWDVQAGRAQ